jgi:hypothetical protein
MKNKIILCLISFVIGSGITGFAVRNYYIKPIPNPTPIHTNPVVSPTIPMEPDLSCELAKSELWHYRNDLPVINWKVTEQTKTNIDVMIDGKFYMRTFTQDVTIPIAQVETSNFKLYLGIGIGTVAAVGAIYGGYKLIQVMK